MPLSNHPNGMTFSASLQGNVVAETRYFSIGRGMVEDQHGHTLATSVTQTRAGPFPYAA